MNDIPECFYRVSTKALILNEARDAFLILQERNGWWDLPGGGLEWGALPQGDVAREIEEEMLCNVASVSDTPCYFYTNPKPSKSNPERSFWCAYVLYEVELHDVSFSPSDECVAIAFVNKENLPTEKVHPQVINFAALFNPTLHS